MDTISLQGRLGVLLRKPWLVVLTAFALRVLIDLLLLRDGYYFGPDRDTFPRTRLAWKWSNQPFFFPGLWLPFQFWLVGIIFKLLSPWLEAPSVSIPIAVNHLFFAGSLVVTYAMSARLGGWRAGLIGALTSATMTTDIWVTLSGLSEPITILCGLLVGFLFGLWAASSNPRGSLALGMGVAAGVASANHYSGWPLSLFVALVLMGEAIHARTARPPRELKMLPSALTGTLLAVAFPFAWLLANFLKEGDAFHFLGTYAEYNAPYSQVDLLERVLGPLLLAVRSEPLLCAVAALAIPAVLRQDLTRGAFLVPVLPVLALVVGSSIGQLALPYVFSRYWLLVFWFLIPYVAAGIGSLARKAMPAGVLLSVGLVAMLGTFGLARSFSYQNWIDEPTRATQETILAWLEETGSTSQVIVELPKDGSGLSLKDVLMGQSSRVIFAPSELLRRASAEEEQAGIWRAGLWVVRDLETLRELQGKVAHRQTIGDYVLVTPGGSGWASKISPEAASWIPVTPGQFHVQVPPDWNAFGFAGSDPKAGEQAGIERVFALDPGRCYVFEAEIRDDYSLASYPSRFVQQVTIWGKVVWSHDISGDRFAGWQPVRVRLVSSTDEVSIRIGVLAIGQPETGWDWGSASRTCLRGVRLRRCDAPET